MKERLIEVLSSIELLIKSTEVESVSIEICKWYEEKNISTPKQFLTDNLLIIGKSENDNLLVFTLSERMPGSSLAVIKPNAKTYKIKFPVDSSI
ncbi:hypothetical protein ACFOEW_11480 [Alteromonas oceani]|uniref:Uncharacterized protein n=1 Tax=Alteromonas oceani TaxID=2071609 RepID=A0ABV7K4N9_9ALTE|nr:hypothetical protein [Alteromonas oceani]